MTSQMDLTTSRGRDRARRKLSRRGWPCCELNLGELLALCPDEMLHELACRFIECVLPAWERQYPDDGSPRQALENSRRRQTGRADASELKVPSPSKYNALWAATEDARMAAVRAGAAAYGEAPVHDKEAAAAAAFDAARREQLSITVAYMLA